MVKQCKVLQGNPLAPRHYDAAKDCLSVAGISHFNKGCRWKRRNRITDLKKMLSAARRRDSGYAEREIHSVITEPRDGSEYCRYCRMISADGSEYCTYCRSTTDPAGRREGFTPEYSQFLSTGRSGRRSAMLPSPAEERDIQREREQQHAHTVYHLSDRFKELSTVTDQPGTSSQDPSSPGTSKQHG